MFVIAHIGKIPVEEYAPFIVPVIALYVYGRQWSRRHRKKLAKLPDAAGALDEKTIEFVVSRWAASDHKELDREQVPLMYPPGPDGTTASELARRIGADPRSVTQRVEDLVELGYAEYGDDETDQRIWLTVEGIHLMNVTEDALLTALGETRTPAGRPSSSRAG
ncbi:MAG TPA: helix-turn-helix domain-containing protein [Solirubrobacteraceae bacterium]|nr:helix-turn-helix domain-containing protein [Solirubrobacteraceae bacterium]